ncbi:MAG TPA: type II toxin-antitoxin system RelE/ParE family toxin [Acidiferrobacterales bacterium]|nr:type II toxin-antitoxin system RelE/ParE family toxin [Acidiferrobacterales bacterium]
MSTWTVTLTGRAYKQLKKLPSAIQDLADAAIQDLEAKGPKPMGWDVRKTGNNEYRVRLTYRYRMRYRVINEQMLEIEVFYLGHRKDAYR